MTKYWFEPKRFGYGATPTTWQGWLFILSMIAILFSMSFFLSPNTILFYVALVGVLAVTIIVSKHKTRGEWKWRAGQYKK